MHIIIVDTTMVVTITTITIVIVISTIIIVSTNVTKTTTIDVVEGGKGVGEGVRKAMKNGGTIVPGRN